MKNPNHRIRRPFSGVFEPCPGCDECKPTGLMRIRGRGLEIDLEYSESGVVDLVVRTHKKNGGVLRRIFQHIAHALYRAGDLCDGSNNHRPVRVIERAVRPHTPDDGVAVGGHPYILQRWPTHLANGDCSYNTFIVYEGIENTKHGLFSDIGLEHGGQKSTDDAHLLSPFDFEFAKHIDVRTITQP